MGRKRKFGGEGDSMTPVSARRTSVRHIKSAVPNNSPAINNVNLVEEHGQEHEQVQEQEQEAPAPAPAMHEQSLEQKIDSLVQAVGEIKSMVTRRQNENPSSEFTYKSLYIDAVKKIESLMEKQYDSVKELEYARGKIDAYEKVLAPRSEKRGEEHSRSYKSSVPPPLPNADEPNS